MIPNDSHAHGIIDIDVYLCVWFCGFINTDVSIHVFHLSFLAYADIFVQYVRMYVYLQKWMYNYTIKCQLIPGQPVAKIECGTRRETYSILSAWPSIHEWVLVSILPLAWLNKSLKLSTMWQSLNATRPVFGFLHGSLNWWYLMEMVFWSSLHCSHADQMALFEREMGIREGTWKSVRA